MYFSFGASADGGGLVKNHGSFKHMHGDKNMPTSVV